MSLFKDEEQVENKWVFVLKTQTDRTWKRKSQQEKYNLNLKLIFPKLSAVGTATKTIGTAIATATTAIEQQEQLWNLSDNQEITECINWGK